MTLRKVALSLTLGLGLMAGFTGCRPTTGVYVQPWYDVYGYRCGSGSPSPGCNFYWDGTKIIDLEDPYYSSGNLLQFGDWDYVDSYGYYQTFYGFGWLSPTGILYDEYGNALNEQGQSESRDMIGGTDAAENQVVAAAAKDFEARFEGALSAKASLRIAQNLNDFATFAKKQGRARTSADLADFSKRLYGIDAKKAEKVFKQAKAGDKSALMAATVEIGTHWDNTDAETTARILKGFYAEQAAELGLN
jgi:hypothetical protein